MDKIGPNLAKCWTTLTRVGGRRQEIPPQMLSGVIFAQVFVITQFLSGVPVRRRAIWRALFADSFARPAAPKRRANSSTLDEILAAVLDVLGR